MRGGGEADLRFLERKLGKELSTRKGARSSRVVIIHREDLNLNSSAIVLQVMLNPLFVIVFIHSKHDRRYTLI